MKVPHENISFATSYRSTILSLPNRKAQVKIQSQNIIIKMPLEIKELPTKKKKKKLKNPFL